MQLGIDILLRERQNLIKGKRIGILAHAASLDIHGNHTIDRIARLRLGPITALFGPEHGISTQAQDMETVESTIDPSSKVPIYSLYGATIDSLKPTHKMMDDIDVLVVDLQDIGSRYYTYVWTACLCAEACAEFGKQIIICDRPNPIGGRLVEGAGIEAGYESFVGLLSLPVRHGMTIGEIVNYANVKQGWNANIEVVKVPGLSRNSEFPSLGISWANPSPNMRSYTAALLYPGMCLLEATNVSEGRGTDTPFEIVGAPYIDSKGLIDAFDTLALPGVHLAPTSFFPMRQKWAGRLCSGVRWVVEDAKIFQPYFTGLVFIWLMNKLYEGRGMKWRTAPYEFVTNRPAIDLLTGSALFREQIDTLSVDEIKKMSVTPKEMLEERNRYLLYH